MKKQKLSKVRSSKKEADLISNLPDALLIYIISLLPFTEGVRTSVLSHRWKTMWKYSSHLNFDQRQLQKPLIDDYIKKSDPKKRVLRAMRRKVSPRGNSDKITRVAKLITSIIDKQIGPLKSCTIRHLLESCAGGDIVVWMKQLLSKGAMNVSIELEIIDYGFELIDRYLWNDGSKLDLPFNIFTGFEVLELKNYHLTTTVISDPPQVLKTLILNNVSIEKNEFREILIHCLSLENLTIEKCNAIGESFTIDNPNLKYFKICGMRVYKILVSAVNIEVIEFGSAISPLGEVVFETPKLQVLCVYKDVKWPGQQGLSLYGNKLKRTMDIIQIYGGILGCRGLSFAKFNNLSTLCLDIDLTNNSNCMTIYFAMKSCHQLKNLEVNIEVSMNNDDENDDLPYHEDLFWEKMEPCECINELKSICLKGYKGRKFEEGFVKYLVTNCNAIENITIWFMNDCSWVEVVATTCLLSYPRQSPKLHIELKPCPEYEKKYGGNFEKWVTTLK